MKITFADAENIRRLAEEGKSRRELSEMYEVNTETIARIVRRETHRTAPVGWKPRKGEEVLEREALESQERLRKMLEVGELAMEESPGSAAVEAYLAKVRG